MNQRVMGSGDPPYGIPISAHCSLGVYCHHIPATIYTGKCSGSVFSNTARKATASTKDTKQPSGPSDSPAPHPHPSPPPPPAPALYYRAPPLRGDFGLRAEEDEEGSRAGAEREPSAPEWRGGGGAGWAVAFEGGRAMAPLPSVWLRSSLVNTR